MSTYDEWKARDATPESPFCEWCDDKGEVATRRYFDEGMGWEDGEATCSECCTHPDEAIERPPIPGFNCGLCGAYFSTLARLDEDRLYTASNRRPETR